MNDRALLSNLRFQLHDAREDLERARAHLPATRRGTRADRLDRARALLLDAMDEIELVLRGPLDGDPIAAAPRTTQPPAALTETLR